MRSSEESGRQRLLTDLLATALLQGATHTVGQVRDGSQITTVGYFVARDCAIVFATTDDGPLHCIRGMWDAAEEAAELGKTVTQLLKCNDTHELGRLIEKARGDALFRWVCWTTEDHSLDGIHAKLAAGHGEWPGR
jgi:hypothetical protein